MMLAAAPATATASSGRPSATAVPPTPSFAARAGAPVRRAAAATPSVVARAAAGPGPLAATVKDGRVGGDASPVAGLRFDFVVVGGGAAGCVLANRLSADPSKSVLLLEAGGESKGERLISTPVGISRLFRSHFDYNLYTERSEHPAEIDPTTKEGREMYLARGRVLGGSSATNATLYHRGSASDYDAWGVPGWSAADLLPWFRHAEGNRRTAGVKNDPNWRAHHGADGPLPVEDPRFHCALHDRFLDACREMGMSDNRDFNDWSRSQEGFGSFQVTQRRGVRGDAASSYLEPVRSRPNLVVVSQAVASRVAWEGEEEAGGSPRTGDGAPRAAGVFFSQPQLTGRSSFLARLSAGGEVVLAAGAVGTPQLLMLSGVGPADHLREVGVPRVVVDSPRVGRDLQDHPATLTAHAIVKREAMTDLMYTRGGRVRAAPLLRYALTGSGPAASTGCDRGAFVKTDPSLAEPDVQIRYVPALSIDADGVSSYAAFDRLRGRGGAAAPRGRRGGGRGKGGGGGVALGRHLPGRGLPPQEPRQRAPADRLGARRPARHVRLPLGPRGRRRPVDAGGRRRRPPARRHGGLQERRDGGGAPGDGARRRRGPGGLRAPAPAQRQRRRGDRRDGRGAVGRAAGGRRGRRAAGAGRGARGRPPARAGDARPQGGRRERLPAPAGRADGRAHRRPRGAGR